MGARIKRSKCYWYRISSNSVSISLLVPCLPVPVFLRAASLSYRYKVFSALCWVPLLADCFPSSENMLLSLVHCFPPILFFPVGLYPLNSVSVALMEFQRGQGWMQYVLFTTFQINNWMFFMSAFWMTNKLGILQIHFCIGSSIMFCNSENI